MNKNASRNKWRGAKQIILQKLLTQAWDFGGKFSPKDVYAKLHAENPSLPPPNTSLASSALQWLVRQGVLVKHGLGVYSYAKPAAPAPAPAPAPLYSGLLFDNDEMVVTANGKTWRFTTADWLAVRRLVSEAHAFFSETR